MVEFTIVTRFSSSAWIPALIAAAGPEVTETYIDFFTSTIRNRNTTWGPEGAEGPSLRYGCCRFSGRSANYTIESGTFRSRSKVCRPERQNARLESRRRQDAVGVNSQGLGVRLT